MPTCSFCPGRSFVDDNAVRMHKDARHWWCQSCDRLFSNEESLDQHNNAKHTSFSCGTCHKRFASRQALDQHMEDKHPSMFECEYCDKEFSTDEGRLAHEKAKHPPMFECEYCDREFATDEGRLAHEQAKHPPTYECRHCDREFSSEEARSQHEDAKHTHVCNLCSRTFVSEEALQQHKKTKKHVQCNECSSKFHTQDGLNSHKRACHARPSAASVSAFIPFNPPPTLFGSSFSNGVKFTRTPAPQEQEPAASGASESGDGGAGEEPSCATSDSEVLPAVEEDSPVPGAPTPQEGVRDGDDDEQHCACKICQRPTEPCESSICQRPSPVLSRTENPVGDDLESIVPADPVCQDDPAVECQVRCPSCFNVVDAKEGLGDHICAPFESIIPLHCPSCYTQFDDRSSLQEHLEEGRQAFVCQLCATPCCSSEMLQDHLLSHPTCSRCGESFADDPTLCKHVESAHPVIVCWDCDGVVVEQSSLELHYTDSTVHPSCPFCALGFRNSEGLDEHVKNNHATIPEVAVLPESGDLEASPGGEPSAEEQLTQGCELSVTQHSSHGSDFIPPLALPGELSLSIPSMLPQAQHHVEAISTSCIVDGQEPSELAPPPSPTPSEHGSNGSRSRVLTRDAEATNNAVVHDDSRPQSPATSLLAESFSDISSPSSSCHSVVYVSADGIPDYVRENRAYLVATSAASLSSGCTPLRLPSTWSLESLEVSGSRELQDNAVPVSNVPGPSTGTVTHRLHCRICLRDPCDDMTATICGHIFCKRCITQAVVSKSECPVCQSATLLYCLFKLDLSA